MTVSTASVAVPYAPAERRAPVGRLSLMMFLQYAVWGVWLPTLAIYLGAPLESGGLAFTGAQIGWIMGLAGSIGAVLAPFLAGQVADRFLNAERYLGILLIIGGVLNYCLYYARDFWSFLAISVLYSIAYMPTLTLTNSIAFANLHDSERQFPRVRLWGTIGWIVASNAFPLIWLQTSLALTALPPFVTGIEKPNAQGLIADSLRVSGVAAVLYGLFAISMLPATPPRREAHDLAFAKAFGLLRDRGFLVAVLAALPISMIHSVYFFRTSPFLEAIGFDLAHVGPVMSIGQFSEIFFLAILGMFISRLGFRGTLVLGGLAYAIRFGVFAMADVDSRVMVAVANSLHGLCYAGFIAATFIYTERVASPDIRHSAQTVLGIVILGLGPVLAGFYNQWVLDSFKLSEPLRPGSTDLTDYHAIWWTQTAVAIGATLLIALAFRSGTRERATAAPVVQHEGPQAG